MRPAAGGLVPRRQRVARRWPDPWGGYPQRRLWRLELQPEICLGPLIVATTLGGNLVATTLGGNLVASVATQSLGGNIARPALPWETSTHFKKPGAKQ